MMKWIVTFENYQQIKLELQQLHQLKDIKILYITTDYKVFIEASEEKVKNLAPSLKILKYEPLGTVGVALN
jgi:hypothetical protein